jgi:hypothetical protein
LYWLGRDGPQLLAAGLAMPFLLLALISLARLEAGILTVLLASLAPVAAWAGIARRARGEDACQPRAQQAEIARPDAGRHRRVRIGAGRPPVGPGEIAH